jgi:hypothetical protein
MDILLSCHQEENTDNPEWIFSLSNPNFQAVGSTKIVIFALIKYFGNAISGR